MTPRLYIWRRAAENPTMSSVPRCLLLVLAAAAAAAAVTAQAPPPVAMAAPACLPRDGHAVVAGEALVPPGAEARTYFRRAGFGDFYYLPMQRQEAAGGPLWAVLPMPEPENELAELWVAVVGADGTFLSRTASTTVPVTGDCVADLTAEQSSATDELVIGETARSQKHRKVAWWQCEGIVTRIDVAGERRDDDACAPLAWFERPELVAPFAVLGGGGILTLIIEDEPPGERELSPAQP